MTAVDRHAIIDECALVADKYAAWNWTQWEFLQDKNPDAAATFNITARAASMTAAHIRALKLDDLIEENRHHDQRANSPARG
jgi:hypothetical protein